MAKLKVFYGHDVNQVTGKQCRVIVAATSAKRVADIMRCSVFNIRTYWSETGNKKQIEIAVAAPGVPFYTKDVSYADERYLTQEQWEEEMRV